MYPALAVSGSCVTVSQARQQAAAGKLRPEYARMTDAQLYALGFCADRPTTPSPGGCSPGYIKYQTSAGHCCQEGYPYYRDGSCYKCPEGYYTYDTSAGHCCQQGYPYYDSDSNTCYSSDPNADGGGGNGDDGGVFGVLFIIMIVFVFIAAVAVGVSSAKKKTPPADPVGAPQEPRKMHGMMQFGGDAPGRDIIRGPGPIPKGFHGPTQPHPAYTAGQPPQGGETQTGIPPSWPSAEGGHPEPGMGVISIESPLQPPVSSLQVSRVETTVHLDWKPPNHDPSKGELIGYEVFRQEPTGMSTALQKVSLGTVDPGVHGFDVGYLEGARFYNVRPIYRTPDGIVYGPGF